MSMRTPSERAAIDSYRTNLERERRLLDDHRQGISTTDVLLLLAAVALFVAAALSTWRG